MELSDFKHGTVKDATFATSQFCPSRSSQVNCKCYYCEMLSGAKNYALLSVSQTGVSVFAGCQENAIYQECMTVPLCTKQTP